MAALRLKSILIGDIPQINQFPFRRHVLKLSLNSLKFRSLRIALLIFVYSITRFVQITVSSIRAYVELLPDDGNLLIVGCCRSGTDQENNNYLQEKQTIKQRTPFISELSAQILPNSSSCTFIDDTILSITMNIRQQYIALYIPHF